MSQMTRRSLLGYGLAGCTLCGMGMPALGRIEPSSLDPLVPPGYVPSDADERGLWQECDRIEREVAASNLLISDDNLRAGVEVVLRRLLGDQVTDLRLYLVRNPDFNASMWPNGMMMVHSGLLARMRNEAQLAAVLGHEAGHYLRRHSVQTWRSVKTKTALASVVSLGGVAATGATNTNYYDLATLLSNTLYLSIFSFSRTLESEADAYGLKLVSNAGYTPGAAADVWQQLIEERRASASARNKRYRDGARSGFSTHPPTDERMRDLANSARTIEYTSDPDVRFEDGRQRWLNAIGSSRPALIEEQIRLNDAGASLYLLDDLARDGWDSTLRYFEGEAYRLRDEEGDAARAAAAYARAVEFEDVFPDAWRAHGYALLKNGDKESGRLALQRYLTMKPDAPDAAMVRFSLAP